MIIQASGDQPLFIQKQNFEDTTFRLGLLDWADRLLDSTLTNCKIDMIKPRASHISGCRFFGCEFFSKKKVKLDFLFCSNYWEDCVFLGKYESTLFGYWTESLEGKPCPWGDIAIKGCDFSQGVFQGCSLSRADVDSIRFPKWPHFTVLHPSANKQAWYAADLPFLNFNPRLFQNEEAETSAIIYYWPWVVKLYSSFPSTVNADPDDVKATLQKFDFIRL